MLSIQLGSLSEIYTVCMNARRLVQAEAGDTSLLSITFRIGKRTHTQIFQNSTASGMAVDIMDYLDGQGLDGKDLSTLVSIVSINGTNKSYLA